MGILRKIKRKKAISKGKKAKPDGKTSTIGKGLDIVIVGDKSKVLSRNPVNKNVRVSSTYSRKGFIASTLRFLTTKVGVSPQQAEFLISKGIVVAFARSGHGENRIDPTALQKYSGEIPNDVLTKIQKHISLLKQ